MNKNRKSRMCLGNKKTTSTDEDPVNKIMKLDPGNASPQRSCNAVVSGHSTPIRKGKCASNVEDSPELDYRYSPISMICTQEGGNEVAWDWHTPVKKGSEDKLRETSRRTKKLQKKRNSNSPLLHKPFKKKQVKITDDIGKFTAELKALNEKIGNIQHYNNDRNSELDIRHELDSKLMINSDNESNDDIMAEDVDDVKPEVKEKIDSVYTINNNNVEKGTKYQDLFDDSIEDSMVRCSQQVEEKFNLQKNIKPDPMVLTKVGERKESSVFENGCRSSALFNSITESSRSSASRASSSNTSIDLKTYSNTSHKSAFNCKLLNNNTASVLETKPILANSKSTSKSNDFPDDSFDDCLATCMVKEESKPFSKLTEYDFCSVSNTSHSPNKQYSPSKATKNNGRSNHQIKNKVSPRESPSTLENRKFFKTRSLSDRCHNQSNKNISLATSAVKSEKQSVVKPSVSTTYPSASDKNPYENDNFPAINGTETAGMSRILQEERLSGRIVKYKSTSNLVNTKEVKDLNYVRCTPEEIERKRLEAKKKLEAKRKDSVDNCSAISTVKEESKAFSKLTQYDSCSGSGTDHSSNERSETSKINRLSSRQVERKEPSQESPSILDDRKFFKARSLSDQCHNQSNKNINLAMTTVKSEKQFVVKPLGPSASDKNPYKNDNFPAINSTESEMLRMLQGEGLSGRKYKSTSNLLNSKEVKESNCVRCTPEEIERKRLEAKMKLEAKRKAQQMRVTSNPLGATVKR